MSESLLKEILSILGVPTDKVDSMLHELDELIWGEVALKLSEKLPESERQKIQQAFEESKNPQDVAGSQWSQAEVQAAVLEATRTILKDYLEAMAANITEEQREKITEAIQKYQPK